MYCTRIYPRLSSLASQSLRLVRLYIITHVLFRLVRLYTITHVLYSYLPTALISRLSRPGIPG